MQTERSYITVLCLLAIGLLASAASGATRHSLPVSARNVIVPQAGGFALDRRGRTVDVTAVRVGAVITETTARTTMDIRLWNPTGSRQEAQLVVPIPRGAVVRGFA
ncbi:MAG: VIT domain-containing protein [Candidatus Brocadiia bacterium]